MNKFINFESARFLISGVLLNTVGFLLYMLLVYFGVYPKFAMSILYWLSFCLSFFINRSYVFFHSGNLFLSFLRYLFVYLIGYIFSLAFMTISLDWLNLNYVISMILTTFFMVIYFYILQKKFVFN